MAIQTGIFKTPTGGVYDPAQQIERGFDKTTGIVTDFLQRKANDYDQQQAAFSQMYSNLGELESKLQENYAGMNQQMIDSTREWLKENMKAGKRATDPEFQMGLSQRVGRIRAGMANADRNRELLKQAGEMIKSDPSILDKAQAMGALYSRMNDPDFLISKNEFRVDEFLDDYVNPTIIAQNVAGMLKSTGTFSDKITDPTTGKLIEETVSLNEAISAENPLIRNPDGTTRLNIKPSDQLVNSLVSGEFGSQASRFIAKMATQNYGGVNPDTLKKAATDFLSRGMGPNYMRKTLKTAEELKAEELARQKTEANINLTNENIKLANAKMRNELADLAKSEKEKTEMNNRWSQFLNAYDSGQESFFGDLININPNITGFKWETENSDLVDAVSSREKWSSLTRDERLAAIEKAGVSNQVPSAYGIGRKETDSDQAYNAVKSVVDQMPKQRTGVSYLQKTGSKEGQAIYQPVTIAIDPNNEDDLIKAFKALENIRITGKNYKPVAEPTTTGTTTKTGFKSAPKGGFN